MSLSKSRFIEMFGDPIKNEKRWPQLTLDSVCDGIGDGLHGTPEYDDLGAFYFINGNNLINGTIVITPSTKKVNETTYKKYFTNISSNALLLSINGTLGKIAFYNDEAITLGKSACYINLKSFVNRYFVFELMRTDPFLKYLEENSTKSTIKNVSLKTIRNFKLISPPEILQNDFIAFSKQIDKSKFLLQKILEKLELLKKSRFIEMFDKENKEVSLKDCCEIHARIGWQALTQKEHMKSGEYVLVTGTDFVNNAINFDSCVYVKKERYEMDPHIILKENDILVTKDGTIGKVAIVKNLPKPATLNSGIFVIRPDRRFDKDYIAYVFKGPIFEHFVDSVKTGATIKHLNQNKLVEFKIPVPTLKKQEEFSLFCHHLDKSKLVIQKSLEDLVGKS